MIRTRVKATIFLLTAGLLVLVIVNIFHFLPKGVEQQTSAISVKGGFSAGSLQGFERVLLPRKFEFPQDHGPHPEYKTEWWYFTGNLTDRKQRHFGYQLTFFRIGLLRDSAISKSRWRTSQIYMAHFAITDTHNQKFFHKQRISRDAVDLVGSRGEPFAVWFENWSAKEFEMPADDCRGCLNLELTAASEGIELSLRLSSMKPVVLQGEQGLSRKSEAEGNNSYYYSLTRLETKGRILIEDQEHTVSGLSWLDREWSTTALDNTQSGWDWFALHLSDGRDLMYYQLRDKKGNSGTTSSGVLVSQSGSVQPLDHQAVVLRVLDYRVNPISGIRYPAKWRLHIPNHNLNLELTPWLADQELHGIVRYWEGAVKVEGTSDNQPIQALGYVELTGYQ